MRRPSCVGLQLTIYDPDLDPDGGIAAVKRVVEASRELLPVMAGGGAAGGEGRR